jgi:hypothetical protein
MEKCRGSYAFWANKDNGEDNVIKRPFLVPLRAQKLPEKGAPKRSSTRLLTRQNVAYRLCCKSGGMEDGGWIPLMEGKLLQKCAGKGKQHVVEGKLA